jgi:hypothetical protein
VADFSSDNLSKGINGLDSDVYSNFFYHNQGVSSKPDQLSPGPQGTVFQNKNSFRGDLQIRTM